MRRVGAPLLASAILVGCATGGPVASSAAPTGVSTFAPSSTARPSPSPTPEPSPTPPALRAPSELIGTWHTVLGGPQGAQGLSPNVELRIHETRYGISRGPEGAAGKLSVEGDRISFYDGDICVGTGTYNWSIAGGELSFVSVEPDPCGGRADVLDGITYTGG